MKWPPLWGSIGVFQIFSKELHRLGARMAGLNTTQREAVTAGDGPALVLAGAGTGKTRVIVERIVWLIGEGGVDGRDILALTFTNRAAGEMKSRIAERLGLDGIPSWTGTFHAFGLYILRREMDKLERSRSFTIFDDQDQLSLMKRLIKGLPAKWVRVSPRAALTWISRLKQDLEAPDPSQPAEGDEDDAYGELWLRYHGALKAASAVDFDDLLVLTARLFDEHPEVLEKYRRRYRHVLVDEYQDTNRAQYRIIRALSGEGGNLFVVGDEDQAIYSWRGADLQNILGFAKDFPGARVFRLEQNYRSTAPILAAANAVVKHNVARLGKNLWSEVPGGEKVVFYRAEDAEDEARFVVETMAKSGASAGDVAVLYRTNGQARVLEEAFRRKGVAYVIVGGIRFYARKEIKDLLCYLRLVVNPADNESLRRIINVPLRGIGGVTLERLEEYASRRNAPLLKVLHELEDDQTFGPRVRTAAGKLATLFDDLALESKTHSVAEVLERILEETAYREYVRKSDEKDFRDRLEVVDEFVSACGEFDAKGDGGLEEFLQDLSLMTDVDDWEQGAPAVTLMTCHSAKGLEFDHVFLVGLEEGLLPHGSSLDSETELEEERRLCYVAMTRARKTLTLTAAETRTVYGEARQCRDSRFLEEISKEHLAYVEREGSKGSRTDKRAPGRADGERLKTGTLVRHARFGRGRVMFTAGSGAALKVRIRFDKGFSRQFMVSAAPLEIIEGKQR